MKIAAATSVRMFLFLLVLSAPLTDIARADAIVGTGSSPILIGTSLAAPTAITLNWCTSTSAPGPPPPPTGCPAGLFDTIGNISPSNSQQMFDIFPADDADFAAIAAAVMGGTNTCELDASFVPFGGGGLGVGPCAFGPASSVSFFRLTIDSFQVVFDSNLNQWFVAGLSGPPLLDGLPAVGVTVDAFGTAPTAPEPITLTLVATGLAGVAFRKYHSGTTCRSSEKTLV